MNVFKRGRIHTDSIHIPFDILVKIVHATLCAHNERWDILAVINLLMTCTEFKMYIPNMLSGFNWKQHFLIRKDYLKLKKFILLNESDAKIAGIILVDGTVMEFSWENIKNNRENIQQVCIPDSVTSIDQWAFDICRSLTSITIPHSVTSIGARAFNICRSLTSITIPNSVTSIGNDAFCCCSSLTSINIPSSVTSIDEGAFHNCKSLTLITIPSSVTSIGEAVFSGCSSLTSITIPSSVTSIGDATFHDCKSLTLIDMPDSAFLQISKRAFFGCKSLTSIITPTRLITINREKMQHKVQVQERHAH